MGLKEMRIKKGLTQQKLAIKAELSIGNIYKIEKNNNCQLKTAYKIAKILNSSIEEIFFNEE